MVTKEMIADMRLRAQMSDDYRVYLSEMAEADRLDRILITESNKVVTGMGIDHKCKNKLTGDYPDMETNETNETLTNHSDLMAKTIAKMEEIFKSVPSAR